MITSSFTTTYGPRLLEEVAFFLMANPPFPLNNPEPIFDDGNENGANSSEGEEPDVFAIHGQPKAHNGQTHKAKHRQSPGYKPPITDQPVKKNSNDPATIMRDARLDLEHICEKLPVEAVMKANLFQIGASAINSGSHPTDEARQLLKELANLVPQYRTRIRKCLEKQPAPGSLQSNASKQPFPHTVLEFARMVPLSMILFLLRIVLKEDPSQMMARSAPDWKPLLHHAIEQEAYDRDRLGGLTSEICRLMKEPNDAICMVNELDENCIHLAIRHNIQGTESIINLVDTQNANNALTQMRISTNSQEPGNTPLHDALHFSKVALHEDTPCLVMTDPSMSPYIGAGFTNAGNEDTPIIKPVQRIDSGLSLSERQRRTGTATHFDLDKHLEDRNSGSRLCQSCTFANEENHKVPDYDTYFGVVKALITKAPGVLKQQNAFGQCPYAFHHATREESTEERLNATRQPHKTVDDKQLMPDLGLNPRVGGHIKPNGRIKPDGSTEVIPDHDLGRWYDSKSQHTETHEWKYNYTNSNRLTEYLEDKVVEVAGGYKNAIEFLFPDLTKSNAVKSREFHHPRRVNSQTRLLYDFLIFEPRLSYLRLSLQPDRSYILLNDKDREKQNADDAKNIESVFRWLRNDKGVNKIVYLEVKDNPHRYCSEETIECCLKHMDEIRFLDWDKPDISLNTISKAKGLSELSLYSSGTNAVFHHWSDTKGLVQLRQLRKVWLYAKMCLDTENIKRLVEQHLDNHDHSTAKSHDQSTTKKHDQSVASSSKESKKIQHLPPGIKSWLDTNRLTDAQMRETEELIKSTKTPEIITAWIETGEPTVKQPERSAQNFVPQRTHPGFEAVKAFNAAMVTNMSDRLKVIERVKVALVDDGVDPEYESVGKYLANNGFPLGTPDGKTVPFYTSTKQHGSKMAWVISTICPFVEIYVAKMDNYHELDLGNPAFDPERAVKAVEWALKRDADILSMSWLFRYTQAVEEHTNELTRLLDHSPYSKPPIMYCAAKDTRGDDSASATYYPAGCNLTQTVGAADIHCKPKPYVTLEDTEWLFPGTNVFEDPADSGNSVATAVAAGVAALVLFCLNDVGVQWDQIKPKVTPKQLMEQLFKGLQDEHSKTKYVDLAKLFKFEENELEKISSRFLVDRLIHYIPGLRDAIGRSRI
ncbi:hypothetical protein SMACR_09638 [Sordaria macrospora]|uniref:WGS project CABT00000000 data, contig 2.113 n=2 Tax=Sordaria macrospora TaxID=5147 RepID=F7WCC5_SORMK|nr:uncharacterized protein SMAC_09638 [Sordaria macrospora k-hell]KAA8623925.1 hypothetical protein SMACR_09638 [Sordaria macrospora]CCC05592.1 unnamed protein product [Sordaria macrospora k-hell]